MTSNIANILGRRLAPKELKTLMFTVNRTMSSLWFELFTMLAATVHDNTREVKFGYYWVSLNRRIG